MTHRLWMATVVSGLVAGGSLLAGSTISQTDLFNDGLFNSQMWKPNGSSNGRLLETGGHLALDTGSGDPLGWTFAMWFWKPAYVLTNADVLEFSMLISMPTLTGLSSMQYCHLGGGLKERGTSSILYYVVTQHDTGRHFLIQTEEQGGVTIGVGYELPLTATRFYIKLRYVNSTGKVSFWYRGVHQTTWTKLGTNINLRHRWGRDGSTSLAVRPFVYGSTDHLLVTPEDKIYLDNVTVTHWLND